MTGVELRADLVKKAQANTAQRDLQGLKFEASAMNVMIALHACDAATDHAIHLRPRAGGDLILCNPSCHKQIRPQLLSPDTLQSVFRHGTHAEQQAEMLTVSLRAQLLLEASGYDTQVFGFIALEHTRKNKLILAAKRQAPRPAASEAAWVQVDELECHFGIGEQALET